CPAGGYVVDSFPDSEKEAGSVHRVNRKLIQNDGNWVERNDVVKPAAPKRTRSARAARSSRDVSGMFARQDHAGVAEHGTVGEGLVAHSLGKSYKRRPVVRGVSLSVRRGEAIGLLGPNGAGKTTVFYMISGLIAADFGS